jgi:hypothetical protein
LDYTINCLKRDHGTIFLGHLQQNFGIICLANSSTNRPYIWTDDEEYDYGADPSSDGIRMEISLCFGRHKSREGCSAKVDAMLEKLALEKVGGRGQELFSIRILSPNSFSVIKNFFEKY